MAKPDEHRQGPDRRRQPRGGRRTEDRGGFSPLVLLVGDDGQTMSMAEAVLARLRFAVATSRSVEEALDVVSGIRPEIVVVGDDAADRVRGLANGAAVVVLTDAMRRDPETLIPVIRDAIRAKAR